MGLFDFFRKAKDTSVAPTKGKCFEDDFSDIQSGLISLCLEFTNSNVDTIFGYCSIEEKSLSFNAFFEKDGKILSTVQAAADVEMTGDFLRIGTHDLMKFRDVCSKWNKTVPKQIKMIYDVKTGKFNADISYESRIPYELNGGNIFMEWMEQEKNKRN